MAKVGALIVGIGAYDHGPHGPLQPLNYAVADADGFEAYVRTCWPTPADGRVIRIAEAAATLEGVEAGFATLAQDGPYDLHLVFLAGHGLAEADHRGFMVQPTQAGGGLSLLTPSRLDVLLNRAGATRTVLILDCCYAEAIAGALEFFTTLQGDLARLYVASSRADQKTWEEERAGHGVFTAHLLDLLNTGSSTRLTGVRDILDVDAELFPVLCDQVPLYVLEHKSAAQEPVKGGVAAAAVRLPVARVARRIKERTVLGTVLRRVRQITGVMVASAVASLLFAYAMLYYVEPDRSGALVVRRGTRWLEPAFRLAPTLRVETGVDVADLSDEPAAYALKAGYATGIWTQISRNGYRGWYDAVASGLTPSAAARSQVLMGTARAPGVRLPEVPLDEQSVSTNLEFAAWAALNDDLPGDLAAIFRHFPAADRLAVLSASPFSRGVLDFDIIDQRAADMRRFSNTLILCAALDPDQTFPAFVGFARAGREWIAHHSDREAQEEVRDSIADAFEAIARARADRGRAPLAHREALLLEQLSREGYDDVLEVAFSRVRGSPQALETASRALIDVHAGGYDPDQTLALALISSSLNGSVRSQALVETVYGRFADIGRLEHVALTGFLIRAADARALSPALVARLVTEARGSLQVRERTFMDSERARVLAHAMGQVPVKDRADIYRLIDLVSGDVTPMASSNAERYAALGRQGLDRPGMLEKVSAQARLAKPFAPSPSGEVIGTTPGMTIVVGRGPWIAALAIFGQSRRLSDDDVAVLRRHVADPAVGSTASKALAEQERLRSGVTTVEEWIDTLTEATQAVDRRARRDIIAAWLTEMPRGTFVATLVRLRAIRAVHTEPEVRRAIGEAVADALKRRVRPIDPSESLVEQES